MLGTPAKPKRELWKSLGTTEPRDAKRLARSVIEAWEREFDALRKPRKLTSAELQHVIWNRYLELITADEKLRQNVPTEQDLDAVWEHLGKEFADQDDIERLRVFEYVRDMFEHDQRERTQRLAVLKAETGVGRTDVIADVVARLMKERGLKLDKGSSDYREFAQGVARAELEALARSSERDAGNFGGKPSDPIAKPPIVTVPARGETILELFDRYRKERRRGISNDTWAQSRKIVALFDDFVGGNQHISQLNRKNVRDWKNKLFDWPVKAAELKVFAGMSFLKIIEHNEVFKRRTIGEKTINKYLPRSAALPAGCCRMPTFPKA